MSIEPIDMNHAACCRAFATRDARFDGRLFIAVKTTGVYCRPICPARTPKAANVIFYATAAAAQEAGFRPCLRCRPELSPDIAAYHGSAKTVGRALALIAEGALDEATVDALAERLGVGERQVRRLFDKHVGASPLAVAQTRRVLLAKQLISQTSLPLCDIALAAGFGSVRRFNAVFRELYQRPPSALRRHSGVETSAASGFTILLPYAPPYDWDSLRTFFADRAIAGLDHVDDRGRYLRTIALDSAVGHVIVEPDAERHSLRATVHFPEVASLASIVARLRRLFDLAADPHAIASHLATDPKLAPLIAARPGLRVPGAWEPFELAVRAILGQQVSVTAARRLASRLVELHGGHVPGAPAPLARTFPSATQLASVSTLALGMPRARLSALLTLAQAQASDADLLKPRDSLDATIARLRKLPGIGEWTAQYIALRALREPDAFPAADLGVMRAMAEDGKRPNAAMLLARAERWRPWRAYAAQHLWSNEARASRTEGVHAA